MSAPSSSIPPKSLRDGQFHQQLRHCQRRAVSTPLKGLRDGQFHLGTHVNNTILSAHSLLEHTNAAVLMINVALYDILGHRAPNIHQKLVGSHRSVPV